MVRDNCANELGEVFRRDLVQETVKKKIAQVTDDEGLSNACG